LGQTVVCKSSILQAELKQIFPVGDALINDVLETHEYIDCEAA